MTQRLQITARHERGVCAGGWKWFGVAGLLAVALLPQRPVAAAEQPIGSWILDCREQACRLRHKDRLFEAAGIVADLEVRAAGTASAVPVAGRAQDMRADGGPLVPVIAVRGVPEEVLLTAAAAGKLQASVQFAHGAPVDLPCAVDTAGFLCVPRDEAAPTLAGVFVGARSMTVRMSLSVAGSNPLTVKDRPLALAGTQEALARLRAAGAPSTAPSGWLSLLDRTLKAVGYRNG
ncbi:MAG: hypothetical protein ACJ8AW_29465, partial [Rhodopila sp.]